MREEIEECDSYEDFKRLRDEIQGKICVTEGALDEAWQAENKDALAKTAVQMKYLSKVGRLSSIERIVHIL